MNRMKQTAVLAGVLLAAGCNTQEMRGGKGSLPSNPSPGTTSQRLSSGPACKADGSGEFCAFAIPPAPEVPKETQYVPGRKLLEDKVDNVTVVTWVSGERFWAVGYDVVNVKLLFFVTGAKKQRFIFQEQIEAEAEDALPPSRSGADGGAPWRGGLLFVVVPHGPPVGPGGLSAEYLFRQAYVIGSGVLQNQ